RMDRALREFRVRGVKTNIPFLENLIQHPTFTSGNATTTFIDNTPALFQFVLKKDRATKLLSYLGDVIVNGRPDVKKRMDAKRVFTAARVPNVVARSAGEGTGGTKQLLDQLGPEKFALWVRKQKRL